MSRDIRDLRARGLLAVIPVLAMLFLLAASSVVSTFQFRDGTYRDGEVVSARALNVVRGRPGEAKVEYVVDAKRYEAWVSCDTSCPKEGGRMEVEYSAGDPTRVVRNRLGPYSRLAIGALVGIPVGIAVSVVVLRRDLAVLRRRWAHRAFFAR